MNSAEIKNSSESQDDQVSPTISPSQAEDTTYFAAQIDIPDSGNYSFSWRKLWAFTGPGFLMSIAYLDPGNIESDLKCGAVAKYKLLWLIFWATSIGWIIQIFSARIGTVTGYHIAELCYSRFARLPRLSLWILSEIAIIGSDMQEVIGTAVALYILTNGWLPLWAGVLVTIFDTFTFLFIDKYGLRKLEVFFVTLIAIMVSTFGYELFIVGGDVGEISKGLIIPYCKNCNRDAMTQAVALIGATIQPHNLYLHSALVKSRRVDRSKQDDIADANRYVNIESALALLVAFIINTMVTCVFAFGLFEKSNNDIHQLCLTSHSLDNNTAQQFASHFDENNDTVDVDLYKAGLYLGCQYGLPALYIWAVGILAAGQSSTMTGTYAGQFVMEGFLQLKWSRWKRVLLTRSIAIAPTFGLAFFTDGLGELTGMNDYLNVMMAIMLPFALIPMIILVASPKIMSPSFAASKGSAIAMSVISAVVIILNTQLLIALVQLHLPNYWWLYSLCIFLSSLYTLLILYLVRVLHLNNLPYLSLTPLYLSSFPGGLFTCSSRRHSINNNSLHRSMVT